MDVALAYRATDRNASPAEVAREAEARGFEALLFPEHTHIPLRSLASKYPYTPDGSFPPDVDRLYDPCVAMAAAAAATTRLTVGTAVSLPAEHDAIILAKALASLDHLSGGRVLYGIGFGWNEDEMRDHRVDPARRRATVRETILAMQALWSQEKASFAGELVSFEECWSWPKPSNGANVAVALGAGATPQVFQHLAEYCQGWLPVHFPSRPDGPERIAQMRRAVADLGRDPAEIEISMLGPTFAPEDIERYEELGVRRIVVNLVAPGVEDLDAAFDALTAQYL
jgi:probable F420-dependent oxidoreductase